jgi:ParB family transcriptional regulator, chromosome partitioning protein
MSMAEQVDAAERRQGDEARSAELKQALEVQLGVTVKEIAVGAIVADPSQPRRLFKAEDLDGLAKSIERNGLLQEPGVVPVEADSVGRPTKYRILWGERRWRAVQRLGRETIRCKVIERGTEGDRERLKTMERQWAENADRVDLSPLEEAIAINDAVTILQRLEPETPVGTLIERVAAERGVNGQVGRNLVALLKTPRSLQDAVLEQRLSKEVAFELTRHWNRMVKDNDISGAVKRGLQCRELVARFATERGLEFGVAISPFAEATAQDPKIVRATLKKADDAERSVAIKFSTVVDRAVKRQWTTQKARAALSGRSGVGADAETGPEPLFEYGGKGTQERLTIHLDRVRSPDASPESLAELASKLRVLLSEIEARPPQLAVVAAAGENGTVTEAEA